MSELRKSVVNLLNEIGQLSGCHRMPERSFFYKGYQFPVCARCTGGFDWGIQELKIIPSTNFRRLLTGIFGGFGIFSIYFLIIKYVFKKFQ